MPKFTQAILDNAAIIRHWEEEVRRLAQRYNDSWEGDNHPTNELLRDLAKAENMVRTYQQRAAWLQANRP